MAFTDLPADWPTLPITRPDLVCDVLDLVVSEQARASATLTLLLCDSSDRLISPMQVADLDEAPLGADRLEMLATIMDAAADIDSDAGVLAAIGRPGGLSVTADDLDWADALAATTARTVRLLGVHLVTAEGSRPVPGGLRRLRSAG